MSNRARAAFEAEVMSRLEALDREIALLRQSRDCRDRWSSELRHALAERTQGRAFNAAQLLKHADIDPDPTLRLALDAAMIRTPQEAGSWLRDHAGTLDGVTIARLPRRQWRVYMSDTGVHVC